MAMNDVNVFVCLASIFGGNDTNSAIDGITAEDERAIAKMIMLPREFRVTPDKIENDGVTPDMTEQNRWLKQRENRQNYAKTKYVELGINVIGSNTRETFTAELPDGWRKVETSRHWFEVLDDHGNMVIEFFHDPRFYDECAYTSRIIQ